MITNRALSCLARALMVLPVLFGTSLCCLRPHWAPVWASSMLLLPAWRLCGKASGWAFGTTRLGMLMIRLWGNAEARATLSQKMIIASLVISWALGTTLAAVLGLIPPTPHAPGLRPISVLAGLFMVLLGNRLPKMLTPLSDTPCDAAALQTLRRNTGWVQVLTGLTVAVLWLVLPLPMAMPFGLAVFVAGAAVILLARAVFMARHMRAQLQQPPGAG